MPRRGVPCWGALVASLVAAAGCAGDGFSAARSTTPTSSPPTSVVSASSTAPPATAPGDAGAVADPDPARPECHELTVLMKLDAPEAERAAVAKKLDAIPQVASFRFQASAPQSRTSSAFFVTPAKPEDLATIGRQLAMPGVLSVVYPRQLC